MGFYSDPNYVSRYDPECKMQSMRDPCHLWSSDFTEVNIFGHASNLYDCADTWASTQRSKMRGAGFAKGDIVQWLSIAECPFKQSAWPMILSSSMHLLSLNTGPQYRTWRVRETTNGIASRRVSYFCLASTAYSTYAGGLWYTQMRHVIYTSVGRRGSLRQR